MGVPTFLKTLFLKKKSPLRLPLPGTGLPGLEELSIPPISDKDRRMGCTPLSSSSPMGPFKYYIIKELGGWGKPNDYVIT